MVKYRSSLVYPQNIQSGSFKNSTKTYDKVLCVNFLELFFSTGLSELCFEGECRGHSPWRRKKYLIDRSVWRRISKIL